MNNQAVTHKHIREPLVHIIKRPAIDWWKAWLIRIAAVVAALIVCGIVTVLLTKLNPLDVYTTMWTGAFGTKRRIWLLAQNVAILLCIALAVTPAFKMRFWNLGAEGQVLMGGLATEVCMIFLAPNMPLAVFIPATALIAGLTAALWALIPAVCKAVWGANESLFTLMMNYIAIQIVSYFTVIWSVPRGSGTPRVLKDGRLPVIGGSQYMLNVIVVVVLTVLMFIYLRYSKHGYEIAVVGGSEKTARYVGINVKKVILRTLALSGFVCGIAGLLLVGGTDYSLKPETAGGRGFTAIMVSWLAKFNPLFMVLTSLLIVFLQRGASEIAKTFRLNEAFADILTGIIIFFIIGSEFFINYRIKFRSKGGNAQ